MYEHSWGDPIPEPHVDNATWMSWLKKQQQQNNNKRREWQGAELLLFGAIVLLHVAVVQLGPRYWSQGHSAEC